MKANELRIGNLVVEKGRSPFAIGIEKICDFANGFYKFEPIPLTEEWLMKFGFNLSEFDTYYEYNNISIEKFYDNGWFILDSERGHINTYGIKYVHQLQNLFYCLCGEELVLK